MTITVALFDCDGTLHSAQFGRGMMKYAFEHGRKGTIRVYYSSLLIPYMLVKLKLMSEEKLLRLVIARLALFVQGISEGEGDAVFDWVAREYLLPTQRDDVVARLHEHKSCGHEVTLVSGAFTPNLLRLAQSFGASGFVGTQIEITNGKYSGRIIPPVITGRDKDRQTRKFFASHNIDIDWDSSYAYADSITDMGLFDMVGHPVAVYPDEKLYTLAQTKNWEIIGTPRT